MTKALERGAVGIYINGELNCYIAGMDKALKYAEDICIADNNAIVTAEDYIGRKYDYNHGFRKFDLRASSLSAMLGFKSCDDDNVFERTSVSKKRNYERYIVSTKAFGDNEIRGAITVVDYYDDRPDFLALVGTEYVPSVLIYDSNVAKFEGEELPTMEYFGNVFVHEFSATETFEDAEQKLIRWAVGHNGSIERDRTGE